MDDKELIRLLKEKCDILEKMLENANRGLNSYYVADLKKRQRKYTLPEGLTEDDIAYKVIDRKQGKIFILTV